MRTSRLVPPLILALGSLFPVMRPLAAEEPLATGDSTVIRNGANIALHVPSSLEGPHGPAGIVIFFGGVGDSIAYYQKAMAPLADAADLVVVVPQMPWFRERGQVDPPGVYQALENLVTEIEKRFQTDPQWIVIGGASAGGRPAHELARKWAPRAARVILSSTSAFPDLATPRILHVVADKESAWLDLRGKENLSLGEGPRDSFAIPGGEHSAQIRHVEPWLETEIAAMRLEQAAKTMRRAEEQLLRNDAAQAKAILRSTLASVETLSRPAPDGDAFFQYQTKRRQDLFKSFAPTIQPLNELRAKLFPPAPDTPPSSPSK